MKYEQLRTLLEEHSKHLDLETIERAYRLAEKMHEGQYRKTGEAYVEHPVAVAAIVHELGLDTTSIVAALLHDVVEDTDITLEEIEKDFGKETAHLVDGVTKLGKIALLTQEEEQAENLRKMLLAMSQDIRVMLIKLCDRLHNMRTYEGWKPQKQRDKALEVMEVYAPIAHRLGISNIKDELQDISLRILDPVGYEEVHNIIQREGNAQKIVDTIVEEVKGKLVEFGLEDATVMGRVKSVYGVYRKIYMQGRELSDVYDIYAVRIILNNVAECYNALMLMHDLYRPIPSRFKDYISTPKANMYQSLHTSVIGKKGFPFEIQIRTWDMHHTAEYGVAAHWKYKTGVHGQDNMEEKLTWVRQILESQQDSDDASEILSDIKNDLIPDDVFVFTPKGDVINLPYGATIIDFAYAIHSAVGNRMTGAKVNGRIVPIDYKVNTGEIIEIITAKDKGPSRDWLNIVATSEAKSKIRSWFKKERKEENIIEGKEALDRELRRALISLDGEEYTKFVENLAKRNKLNNAEEMFAALGYGGLQLSKVIFKAKEDYAKLQKEAKAVEPKIKTATIKRTKSSNGVIVEGLDNCLVKFSKCCNPLPGDPIVGFITRGFGVSVHKQSCVHARPELRDAENAGRWVNAYWADNIREDFKATLDIIALETPMIVGEVSMLMTNNRIPVFALNARQMADHRIEMSITIGVTNTEHLSSVMNKLSKNKNIISVTRG